MANTHSKDDFSGKYVMKESTDFVVLLLLPCILPMSCICASHIKIFGDNKVMNSLLLLEDKRYTRKDGPLVAGSCRICREC